MSTTFLSPDTRGRTPLWIVFWLYGVVASHLYFAVILFLYPRIASPAMALLLAGFVIYTAFITRAVWINAGNTDRESYGDIARYLTVAWALNAVLVCGFLFLSHFGAAEPRLPLPF